MITMIALAAAPAARAQENVNGGMEYGAQPESPQPRQPTVPGMEAKLVDGVGYAPELAPEPVKRAIWAANRIQDKPYRYGGGHRAFKSSGYDCSGTISYALHGGGLLDSPLDSRAFMRWGRAGRGEWITVYTNPGHAFVVIAGLRLDTSGSGGRGPRWRPEPRSGRGYRARHPEGL